MYSDAVTSCKYSIRAKKGERQSIKIDCGSSTVEQEAEMERQDILMQITEKLIEEELIDKEGFSSVPEMAGCVTKRIDDVLENYELVPRNRGEKAAVGQTQVTC